MAEGCSGRRSYGLMISYTTPDQREEAQYPARYAGPALMP